MRSARILFAATAAAGTLALVAPVAYASTAGDWDKDDQSHSQQQEEHDKPHGGMHTGSGALSLVDGDDWSKGDHEKDDHEKGDHEKGDHEKPKGGMHTGSGALSLVNADDWSKDKETGTEKEDGYKPEKPKGGMHTGGGGLASTGVNATGALVIAAGLAAFVVVRRRKAAGHA
ncbi:hypothetical protein ACFTWS_28310 [Streptomyces sp. NPDC057027]|uniref:hypothetical protein n=1 Tax=Streptomyces sp. NPDC057027 TaxID=3346004 RepID=UPI0036365505